MVFGWRLPVLISWYRAIGVSRRGFCHRSLVRWRKMICPRPRVEGGGLMLPATPAICSDLHRFLLADSLLYCFAVSC